MDHELLCPRGIWILGRHEGQIKWHMALEKECLCDIIAQLREELRAELERDQPKAYERLAVDKPTSPLTMIGRGSVSNSERAKL
jgi:hypothetical protein